MVAETDIIDSPDEAGTVWVEMWIEGYLDLGGLRLNDFIMSHWQ
jgi:hypothetical protein